MKKIAIVLMFSLTAFVPVVNLTPTAYNVYSPDLIYQNSQLVMYSGGWLVASDIPHDAIYRSVCSSPSVCGTPVKVLDAAPIYQINDPSIVRMAGGYYIMYMTGNTGTVNNIYFSTSWDGILWGPPTLLIAAHWLPSATVKDGHVYLHATQSGPLELYDLGVSGVGVGTPENLTMPDTGYYWLNVDVVYQPSISMWQMVGENFYYDQSSQYIDYLYSFDGVNWYMGAEKIIVAEAGKSVRTPAMHPGTAYFVYYGCSPTRDGMSNQICFYDWSQ